MTDPTSQDPSERTLGQLVASASRDLSTLVRAEVQLAKAELKTEVVHAGLGAGLLGGAGGAGVLAVVFLSIAAAYGISALGIPLGAGFLVVGLLYLVVAAVLGLLGKKNLTKVGPPQRTLETVKDDLAWARNPTQDPRSARTGAVTAR